MNRSRWMCCVAWVLLVFGALLTPAGAQAGGSGITVSEITALQTQLDEAQVAKSSARKKLAIRRVVRACEGLLEKNPTASNRFEVMGVLFKSQQQLIAVDGSASNRRAFLQTARLLAAAPDAFAAIRLDADLLVSQTELAKHGADPQARADALRPLIQRYKDTKVEAKVLRITLLMALEFGDAGLIQHIRDQIAQRLPGDLEMINFQRDHLAGQVFGAPFVGQFEASDGRKYRLPMDGLGKTTGLYFWTKEGDGLEQLKLLAEGWQKVKDNPAMHGAVRYQFISFNLDGLADAGESLLREAGLDWPALHLPGGPENPIYKTYVRNTPKLLTMTPTGYTAMVMSGATRVRPDRGWEHSFQSRLARSWARPRYCSQLQSILAGDFLVIDPLGDFDPTLPPEYKAIHAGRLDKLAPLPRNASSVPEPTLQAIQACFVKPPMRYRVPLDQLIAGYEKADALCREAIAKHPDANDLWLVRNRRIAALMSLWKLTGDRKHEDAAAEQAMNAIEKGYPPGTGTLARFCLARQALRVKDAVPSEVIHRFVQSSSSEQASGPARVAAALLSLDVGDRKLHEQYRRAVLDDHVNNPMLWTASAFLLDRYHRYWMYHPPFTAGWTYGRRMGHFQAVGTPEDAQRTFKAQFKTLDGETYRIPEDAQGKWTVLEFVPSAQGNRHLQRYGSFAATRPFNDVNLFAAVLNDDAEAARKAIEGNKRPDGFPTLLVPGGLDNPTVCQLGILAEDSRPNILVLRPDGTIASFLSGLTMSSQHGNVLQNIIELNDEKLVEQAIARGNIEEAKRLAFAHAPVEQVKPENAPRNWRPVKLTVAHLRARAKVYAAMKEWPLALEDAQTAYPEINSKAGWLSMRTRDLDEIEKLRDAILLEMKD